MSTSALIIWSSEATGSASKCIWSVQCGHEGGWMPTSRTSCSRKLVAQPSSSTYGAPRPSSGTRAFPVHELAGGSCENTWKTTGGLAGEAAVPAATVVSVLTWRADAAACTHASICHIAWT